MRRWLALALLAGCVATPSAAAPSDDAFMALRHLQTMAATPLAGKPGCDGTLPGVKVPTLGDLLASQLSVFEGGSNRVAGQCDSEGRCSVKMSHADGEDVSSTEFRFSLSRGVGSSLKCFMTP